MPNRSISPARLVRQRAAGGAAETVLEEPADMQWRFACATKPQTTSIFSEETKENAITFYALDPLQGKGAKVGPIKRPYFSPAANWSIAPDGSRIAFVMNNGRIEILSLRDRSWHPVTLDQRRQIPQSTAWAADGRGFFVTCMFPDSSDFIYVTLAGTVTRLKHNGFHQAASNPLPSPDGKYIAFESRHLTAISAFIEFLRFFPSPEVTPVEPGTFIRSRRVPFERVIAPRRD